MFFGARNRNRTGTTVWSRDFKKGADVTNTNKNNLTHCFIRLLLFCEKLVCVRFRWFVDGNYTRYTQKSYNAASQYPARVAESVYAADLKSAVLWAYGFKSRPGHQKKTRHQAGHFVTPRNVTQCHGLAIPSCAAECRQRLARALPRLLSQNRKPAISACLIRVDAI